MNFRIKKSLVVDHCSDSCQSISMAGNYFFLITLIAATPNYGYRETQAGKQGSNIQLVSQGTLLPASPCQKPCQMVMLVPPLTYPLVMQLKEICL